MSSDDRSVAELLAALTRGDQDASERLFAHVYAELKGLAAIVRRGRATDTLSTTALVSEAYLRLVKAGPGGVQTKAHFFAVAAAAMRQILVDAARRRVAQKRGGADAWLVTLDEAARAAPLRASELVALDEALERLATIDPRKAQVVEHRFFGGLSVPETAAVLDVSASTVEREWRAARAWLAGELAEGQ